MQDPKLSSFILIFFCILGEILYGWMWMASQSVKCIESLDWCDLSWMGLYKMGKLASELGQFTHFVESHQLPLIGLPLDFAPSYILALPFNVEYSRYWHWKIIVYLIKEEKTWTDLLNSPRSHGPFDLHLFSCIDCLACMTAHDVRARAGSITQNQ